GPAQIGDPVPREHALGCDDQSVAVRRDRLAESVGLSRQVLVKADRAGLVEDAQVHGSGVQIDAAVESVRLVVETHGTPWAWDREPKPASWLGGAPFLKIPRWAEASRFRARIPWDRLSAHPNGGHEQYPGAAADTRRISAFV